MAKNKLNRFILLKKIYFSEIFFKLNTINCKNLRFYYDEKSIGKILTLFFSMN